MDQVMIAEYIGELIQETIMYEVSSNEYEFMPLNGVRINDPRDGPVELVVIVNEDKWYGYSAENKRYPISLDNFKLT